MYEDEHTPGEELEAPLSFQCLGAPVWPRLPLALGYTGGARWVAFSLSQGQARRYDGASNEASNASLLLAYCHHRTVAPHLVGAHLGSAEEDGGDWLVVDTHQQLLYLASAEQARRRLERQWSSVEQPVPLEYTDAELDRLLADWQEHVAPPDPEEGRAEAHRERQANERLMLAWLDQHGVESS
jgi:hypothetical protein